MPTSILCDWRHQPALRAQELADLRAQVEAGLAGIDASCVRHFDAVRIIRNKRAAQLERPPKHLEDGLHRDLAARPNSLGIRGGELWLEEVQVRTPQRMRHDLDLISPTPCL